MVNAVRDYENHVHLLERPVKMETFFGDGLWRNQDLWPWDNKQVRLYLASSVGSNDEQSPREVEPEGPAADWRIVEQHHKW